MLLAAAVLHAPDDPSGRGLLMVVAALLVLLLVSVHVRLLLRVAPRAAPEVESTDQRVGDERAGDEGSTGGGSAAATMAPSVPSVQEPPPPPASAPPTREPVDARRS